MHTPISGVVPRLAALLAVVCVFTAFSVSETKGAAPEIKLDFNREIRPILSENCFACHGPDEAQRKSDLRLDTAEGASRPAKSGARAIVPHQPEQSELLRRITHSDDDERMPPPNTGKRVKAGQAALLRRWIEQGAIYEPHWAFVRPRQHGLPEVKDKSWPRNSVDHFVLAQMESRSLTPSPRADAYSLVRRLYLDLVGLPPTPEEADAFVQDTSPDAYEKLVDQLLASPNYGERWARLWLDLARYADTNGYEKDRPRSIWPYRDWVIQALNADMPFDQFTIEQLAGDLLPDSTLSQRIATGFHRNTMLNEEGGIDPLEFRFHAMTDRVATTGKTWLGLTIGCAQCHTHKYDPITHREYYQFMAYFNNADEPELDVPRDDIRKKRDAAEARIAQLTTALPERFPVASLRWEILSPVQVSSLEKVDAEIRPDNSVLFSGNAPATDVYELVIETPEEEISQLRLEALTDPALPGQGPGRTAHGNFVLTEFMVRAGPRQGGVEAKDVKFAHAEADFAQNGFPVTNALDANPGTGWAIHGDGKWNVNRTATFTPEQPIRFAGGARLVVRLEQKYGTQHTLGRVRLSVGLPIPDERPLAVRRQEKMTTAFDRWLQEQSAAAVPWTVLGPAEAKANLPLLTVLEDNSVIASSDQTKSDTYGLQFRGAPKGITALRLEVLPDERLPRNGPGRIYYEGPPGDFFLSEFTVVTNGTKVPLTKASHSFASGDTTAAATIDGDPQTGWSVNGGQGRAHQAVFHLPASWTAGDAFGVNLLFERYYAAGLGRFRISATTVSPPPAARNLPSEIDQLLLLPAAARHEAQRETLFRHFLLTTPELAAARAEIDKLRREMPKHPTTLVLAERPAKNPRPTYLHKRGEFLQPAERVTPGMLAVLPPLPEGVPQDRLNFARWLFARENPLTSRVAMNRHWATFFGRGIVRTAQDFGFQGEAPSHPELLDWLAVQFQKEGWSVKQMHKLIVMSATYQQSSAVSADLLARDPENKWLARAPRLRLDAELIRDATLRASGLLSEKSGGPSVFPPQPANVTTEGAYGRLDWKVSEGPDRYRRGLYTFAKRTTPYAMFQTFDAPSGEACVVQREVSNSPLQALTLLNDTVFMEVSQAMGRMIAERPGTTSSRVEYLFRRCFTRPPSAEEAAELIRFFDKQQERFDSGELKAASVAGPGAKNANEQAAWTALARALLNLDEAITKS